LGKPGGGGYGWDFFAEKFRSRYLINPRHRVNGYVCDKWSPSPNLSRNLFPPRRFSGIDSEWFGDGHQRLFREQGSKGSQGGASRHRAPQVVLER
jgi:hypothetical protein